MREKTVIVATKNQDKVREIREILAPLGWEVLSRDEAGVPPFEVEETGSTFEENSRIKAEAILACTGKPTLADDSGLCCDYLDGAPGVYSSRFAGIEGDGSDEANNRRLVELTIPVPEEERTARYVCCMTLVFPEGEPIVTEGTIAGHIITEGRGENGFGYDPYFIPEGDTRTFAEYSPEEKNAVSHRGRALMALKDALEDR